MRSKWLLVVLAASLAVNVAGVGVYAYHRYTMWKRRQVFFRNLAPGAEPRLRQVLEGIRPRMDSLREQHWRAKRELGRLALEPNLDSLRVDSLLGVIARTHAEMTRVVFETGRKIEALYPADRKDLVRLRLMQMLEGDRPQLMHPPFRHGPFMMPPPGPGMEEPPSGEGR